MLSKQEKIEKEKELLKGFTSVDETDMFVFVSDEDIFKITLTDV